MFFRNGKKNPHFLGNTNKTMCLSYLSRDSKSPSGSDNPIT